MFPKETFKSITNDDSKENGHPSLRSKPGSLKYDDEYQFHTGGTTQRSSPQETESIMNLKFNQRTESTPQSQLQSKTSIFTGGLNSPRASSLVIPDLEDAQAIIDKLDQPKEILKAFEAYQPKNKDIDIVALKKSERSKIRKYKTSVYLGEFLNGKRHGQGIMIFTPLKIYEGDWENDVKHGKGFEILEKGSRYEGEYVNGKPEGYGKFVWGNGESYEGDWKNGVKHGSGVRKGTQGESYVGEWRNGKAEGHGVHTWKNGDKYEGEFKGFLKHGHGKEKFVNGDSYIGEYVNGKPEGFGEYFWANGCHYKGDFKNGLRHGKGTWTKGTGNADHYEGEWANDKKNGTGVYTWVSGNRYMGSYFDDIRHGYGEMYWVDGGVYKGFWERGIQHGEGKVIIPGKINTRGIFERNTFVDNIDEGGDKEKTEKGALSSRRGDSSPKLNNQHAAAGILATPRGNMQIKPLMKKFGKTNEYSSVGNEQNKNNEFCLLPEIKTGKSSNNTSLLMQSQTTRRNSSSKESIKLEAQNALNKLMEQQGARRIKNLKTLAINDNLKKVSVLTKVK